MEKRKYMLMVLTIGIIFCIGIVTKPSPNAVASIPQLPQEQGSKKIVPFENEWRKVFAKSASLNSYQQIAICSHILHFIDPNFTPAYLARAAAYFSDGEYRQAVEDYSSAISLKVNTADVYLKRAIAYSYMGKHKEALEDLNRSLSLDPKNAEAYYERGLAIYGSSFSTKKAAPDFRKAVELDKSYANADYEIAMETRKDKVWRVATKKAIDYSHYDMYQQAFSHFKLLGYQKTLDPKSFDPGYLKSVQLRYGAGNGGPMWEYRWFFVEMMKTYIKSGQFEAALSVARSATLADMDQEAKAEVYSWRGYAFAGVRKPESFDESRRKALELAPNSPNVYWIIGDTYRMLGKQQEAVRHYQKALSYLTPADQRYVKVSCTLAGVYEKEGNTVSAKAIYQNIIDTKQEIPGIFNPDRGRAKLENAPIYLCYGEAYDHLGNSDKARQYYHAAVSVNRELKDQIPAVYHPTYAEEIHYLPSFSVALSEESAVVLPGRSAIEPVYSG